MQAAQMKLKVLLPYKVFAEKSQVKRIIAVTHEGAFGILPHRLDCVMALTASILVFETDARGDLNEDRVNEEYTNEKYINEEYIAVDEGILVKTGSEVLVSVRNAISGMALSELREAIEQQFIQLDEQEQKLRSVLTKMESGFIRRLATFKQDR